MLLRAVLKRPWGYASGGKAADTIVETIPEKPSFSANKAAKPPYAEMNERSKTGIKVLQAAVAIGLLGDILLRQTPWGLNVLLFNLVFVAATIMLLLRYKRDHLTPQTWALLGAQIFFASMFVLRDSIELRVADSIAIVATLSILFVPKFKVPIRLAGVFHYTVGFLWSVLNSGFAAAALLTADIEWKTANRSKWAGTAVSALRGVLIATPLIIVFGALFMAADLAYDRTVRQALNVDFETIFSHTILFAVFSWATAGYLRGLVIGFEPKTANVMPSDAQASSSSGGTAAHVVSKVDDLRNDTEGGPSVIPDNLSILEHINRSDPPAEKAEPGDAAEKKTSFLRQWPKIDNSILPSAFTLGTVEVGVILGLMNLLFLSFVIFQIPYLFGGMELVQNTPDFKLAEYARRGFGELVAVSALVLPVLLVSHWLVRKESPITERLFRALAGVQIALLFVIMASAAQRLVLLTGNLGYGLTTVRLYPMIVMIWLGIVFVWFSLTVLRGARQYFAWGALWSAFFMLAATHFLNPDEYIVRTNIQLFQQGREFDAKYNASLSADAVPTLVSALPILNIEDQCIVRSGLQKHLRDTQAFDQRSYNFSRSYAYSLIASKNTLLENHERCAPELSFPNSPE